MFDEWHLRQVPNKWQLKIRKQNVLKNKQNVKVGKNSNMCIEHFVTFEGSENICIFLERLTMNVFETQQVV